MTDEELKKIIKVICTADGGCPTCACSLTIKFINEFRLKEDKINFIINEVLKIEPDWKDWKDWIKEEIIITN